MLEPTPIPTPFIVPPASLLPQMWGLVVGLVLIIGAALVANYMKNRR
jgi:hypothetical protein